MAQVLQKNWSSVFVLFHIYIFVVYCLIQYNKSELSPPRTKAGGGGDDTQQKDKKEAALS